MSALENLKIEGLLGHGAFGIVLKAREKNNNSAESFAIKLLFPKKRNSVNEIKRMKRESLVQGKLHKNIIKVLEFRENSLLLPQVTRILGQISSRNESFNKLKNSIELSAKFNKKFYSLKMEVCGESLHKWINTVKEYDGIVRFQVKIVRQMAKGLKFLHDNKLIHRDFKPENVMFANGFNLPMKIGDFGLIRELQNDLSQQTLSRNVGTPVYMAPEVMRGTYGQKADIYSFGYVVWEVLALLKGPVKNSHFGNLYCSQELSRSESLQIIESTLNEEFKRKNAPELIERMLRNVRDRMESISEFLEEFAITVRQGNNLQQILNNCREGDTVHILDGSFSGNFTLKENRVKMKGFGNCKLVGTRSSDSVLQVEANQCKISNLTFSSSGWRVGAWIKGERENYINFHLSVKGESNKLRNIEILNANNGIHLKGDCNMFENMHFQFSRPAFGFGIIIKGNNNSCKEIKCVNPKYGIIVDGTNNSVSNFNFTTSNGKGSAVWLRKGSANNVTSCTTNDDNGQIENIATDEDCSSNSSHDAKVPQKRKPKLKSRASKKRKL